MYDVNRFAGTVFSNYFYIGLDGLMRTTTSKQQEQAHKGSQ